MTDIWAWAERNFATARLGDGRRTRRLVESAARIAAHPEKSFPQVFDWNGLRGFYRLGGRRETTLAAVMQPHWNQTRQAMAEQPLVLSVHDTTELDFSGHHACTGIGQFGNGRGRGLLQHNSLAIVPQPRYVLVCLAVSRARNSVPPDTLESEMIQRQEVVRCEDESHARSPYPRRICPAFSRSPAATPYPGIRSGGLASCWPTPEACGPVRSPSRCSATSRPSGGPAAVTSSMV